MKPALITILIALTILGCGGVARVAEPAGVYDEITVEEYSEAEAHFAGSEGKAMATPFVTTYWTDERCQELLDKRDGLIIAAAALGGLTGVGGLATLIPKDASEAERAQWNLGLGISTLAIGATASTLTLAAKSLSERYEQNCRTERPEPTMEPMKPVEVEIEVVDGGVE